MTRTVLLGDVAKIGDGLHGTPKYSPHGNIPFINGNNLVDGRIVVRKDTNMCDIDEFQKHNKKLSTNTVLISINGTVGNVAMYDSLDYVLGKSACFIDINRLDMIRKDYLYYVCLAKNFQDYIHDRATGTTIKNVPLKAIREYKLILPSLITQERIANILATIDEKIEVNQRMNETLEQMGQALFNKHFITNPTAKDWSSATIGSKYEVILGGTPSRAKQEYWMNGTVGWINSGKVNEFRITEPTELITELALSKSAAKLMPKGTTVLAITGATLGQVSRLEREFAANQSVIGVVENGNFTNELAYFWINHNIEKIIGHQTGGAQQHINKSNIANFELIIPPQAELNDFQNEINPIMNMIALKCDEIQNLTKLRELLIPRLISGKIKV